jgi:uracil-DNA glycosylase
VNRLDVRERILECESCDLHQTGTPVPFHGEAPAHIAVLGEGPGKEENARGRPFVGPAGRLFREELETVGLDPEALTWMNVTCCWGGPGTNPSPEHVAACRENREMQLDLIRPTWLLIVGQVALQAVRPDLHIRRGRGRPFYYRGAVAYCCYHPSAALRNAVMLQPLREDLARFVDIVDAGVENWWQSISDRCVTCADYVHRYDPAGVGWCLRHWPSEPTPASPLSIAPAVVEAQSLFEPGRARFADALLR